MITRYLIKCLLSAVFFVSILDANTQNLLADELNEQKFNDNLILFYGKVCPHCARFEAFLDELEKSTHK